MENKISSGEKVSIVPKIYRLLIGFPFNRLIIEKAIMERGKIIAYCLQSIASELNIKNKYNLSLKNKMTADRQSIIVNISVKTKTLVPKK